jgi:outer membrane protein assembly factor BamB
MVPMRLGWVTWAIVATALVVAGKAGAENWPQFRGARGGVSTETGVPVQWTATSNVAWRVPLPGPGHSSPIVWGDRIFLTAFREQPGGSWAVTRSVSNIFARGVAVTGRLVVLSLDRASGKVLWERDVGATRIEEIHPTNSPASPTPVTDGQLVYAYFGSYGLVAFDFSGNKIWEKRMGPFPNEWGSGSSPILHGSLLILNSDTDGEDMLLALDKATGKTVWQASRAATRAWPVPVIWHVNGQDQIVVSGSGHVVAYDAANGRETWRVDGMSTWVSPTPVIAHGLLFVTSSGQGGNVVQAIRPGGRGNITATHVVWRNPRAATYVSSPIVVGEHLYTVKNGGVVSCLDAKTGELLWQQRVPGGGDYYASPVAVENRIYMISEEGVVSVVAASPRFELLGTSDLGERTMASPAVSGGQMFIRTDTHLWAVGRPRTAPAVR